MDMSTENLHHYLMHKIINKEPITIDGYTVVLKSLSYNHPGYNCERIDPQESISLEITSASERR